MNNYIVYKSLKRKILLVMTFIASVFYCSLVFAKNNVSSIVKDVVIHDNGSATITEQWIGTFNEGTEVYIPIEDTSLIVRNLKVKKNNQEYLTAARWDVNASFEEKKFRCGINKTSRGVKLCFGITEYGDNVYTFSYDIDPLVKSYKEADGFNFQFMNPDMDIYPTTVNIRIGLENGQPINDNNAHIWGFGYDGEVNFGSGFAVAYTTSPLQKNYYMNIMLKLYKGIISPNVVEQRTFEDLKDQAFEDSTYGETLEKNNDKMAKAAYIGLIVVFISSVIGTILTKKKRKDELKKFYKESNYFRDTPNDKRIELSHVLFQDFDIWNSKESNVICAIIMQMINDGNLEPLQEKTYGFFGNEKINTSLRIGKEPTDELIKELYDIIIKAAGDDGILQENELKKYATANYNELNNYLDSIEQKGHNVLNLKDGYKKIFGKNLNDLSDSGKKELSEVYGLRKFLDEFTLISERSVTEGVIWENLIVYATLFGLAKKVLSELKEIYPDRIAEINNYAQTYYISDTYFRTLYYTSANARRAAEAARMAMRAAEGYGGRASMGGGGGFSGGGSGGGTR